MKKILIAVDFSDNANDAARYAVQFGKSIGTFKYVFHNSFMLNALEFDMMSADPLQQARINAALVEADMDYSPENVKLRAENKIKDLIDSLQLAYGAFNYEINVAVGDLVDNIEDYADEEPVAYIVMGITGKGKIAQKLIGSNTMQVVQEVEVPVIVVPIEATFEPIKDIALAMPIPTMQRIDYPWEIMHDTFKQINANINVVSVSKELSEPNMRTLINENKIITKFQDLPTAIYYYEDHVITDGLLAFSSELKVQMISTVAGEHSLIGKLFKPSVTETLAYKTTVPLLVFKED